MHTRQLGNMVFIDFIDNLSSSLDNKAKPNVAHKKKKNQKSL